MITLMPVLLYILTVLAGTFLYLYIREYRLRKNPKNFLDENTQKGFDVLHQAIKKSQDVISAAEMEAIKIVADSKFRTNYLSENLSKQFESHLINLSTQADESFNASEQLIENRINLLFEKFEQNLSNFLTETENKSTKAIDLEIQAARQLIDTYKTEQLKLIDENLIAMLERTLSLVLAKKLSLKDQVDLVYESLEKAKAEKFII